MYYEWGTILQIMHLRKQPLSPREVIKAQRLLLVDKERNMRVRQIGLKFMFLDIYTYI